MRSKWFLTLAICATMVIGIFVADQTTEAQREQRQRQGGDQRQRGGQRRGGGRMDLATTFIGGSWVDLTFSIKADDQTLTQARPVFQKAYNDLKKSMAEVGQSGDFQAIREKMQSVNSEFKSGLEKVLTEEQLAKLDKWQQSQQDRMRGGDRPGGGSEDWRGAVERFRNASPEEQQKMREQFMQRMRERGGGRGRSGGGRRGSGGGRGRRGR